MRLYPGQLCAACEAQAAWSRVGERDRLVIDRAAIDEAIQRRGGEAAGEPLRRRALVWGAPAVTLALAAFTAWCLLQLLAARSIGPLGSLLSEMRASARWATALGLLALVAGVVAIVRMRRRRHFRRLGILASHLLAIIAGCSALVIGIMHWIGLASGFGGAFTSMPARQSLGESSQVERIINATVVVLAPGADGDARELAMGTGAVVAADDHRAWIVTCSHVAMPYAAVGTFRHARDAQPVWVQLSDGREGKATVRWAAPPPLDVVLVELPIAHPPDPVVIAADTSEIRSAASVTFVPNPYRAGWKVLRGALIRRESHRTPAGTYDLLYTDLPVTHGDSGSGLYDARGELIGLNTWTLVGGAGSQGISLPSETMRVLVDAIHAGRLDRLDEALAPAAERLE
ncbi:MAG TPA: trypsin-like peptidase domain-containing protein [Kofleriaceae bacterium]|nr:trypsin-like peptidase domain-containing protein [Kofleriaceae bacterium]